MAETVDGPPRPLTSGTVFRWPLSCDVALRILWRGAERSYREKVIELARLDVGESVLDIGCGTGTLAIAAKRWAGPAGNVVGIDASAEMIARARRKAAKAAADVEFRRAAVEALPFASASFEAVLCTTVLHCLPPEVRRQALGEMRRVLKPGGRLLVVDFGGPAEGRRGLLSHHAIIAISISVTWFRCSAMSA
jgi:ubiquinone/menaquinone biosynthesis C-methylase UbiE